MKKHGASLVPTLATYAALADEGAAPGLAGRRCWPSSSVCASAACEAIRIAQAEGVPIAFGTDLLGHMHARQSREFALRAPAMTPVEILQSATSSRRG